MKNSENANIASYDIVEEQVVAVYCAASGSRAEMIDCFAQLGVNQEDLESFVDFINQTIGSCGVVVLNRYVVPDRINILERRRCAKDSGH